MKFLGIVGLAIAGSIILWQFAYPTHVHRFRLTVAIETPTGLVSGSSVYEVQHPRGPRSIGTINYGGGGIYGDAIFLSLPNGRNLISLLPREDIAPQTYRVSFSTYPLGADEPLLNSKGQVEVKSPLIPRLVTFTDLNDPTTAKVVYSTGIKTVCGTRDPDPRNASGCAQFIEAGTQTHDRLSETFGSGYAFKRATLEMVPVGIWPLNLIGITGTPVTRGIEGKVLFLAAMRENGLLGRIDTTPGKFTVNYPYFSRRD
jgi:hypothetical protein